MGGAFPTGGKGKGERCMGLRSFPENPGAVTVTSQRQGPKGPAGPPFRKAEGAGGNLQGVEMADREGSREQGGPPVAFYTWKRAGQVVLVAGTARRELDIRYLELDFSLIFPGHCDKLADCREVIDVTYLELPLGRCSLLRDIPPPAPENGGYLSRSLSPKLREPGPPRASWAQRDLSGLWPP